MNKLPQIGPEMNPEVLPENILETSRIVVVKKLNTAGRYQLLLCSNHGNLGDRTGKDLNKAGKSEVPGGKLYGSPEGLERFLALSEEEKAARRLHGGLEELEEETGVYINPDRARLLTTLEVPMVGQYKKIPTVTHRRINFYVVVLNNEEYQTFPADSTAHLASDDKHDRVSWEDIDIEDLTQEGLGEIMAQNSFLPPEDIEKARALVSGHARATSKRIIQLIENHNVAIRGSAILPRKYGQQADAEKASIIDFNGSTMISYDDFLRAYEIHFGRALNSQEIEGRVKNLLTNRCLPEIRSKILFSSLYKPNEDESPEAFSDRVEKHIRQWISKIRRPEDLYRFASRANKGPVGRKLLKSFFGFGKIANLPYFGYIDAHTDKFEESLLELTQPDLRTDGSALSDRRILKGFDGKKHFIVIDSGTKTAERMAKKSTTKPEINPAGIKDVYRARVIVEEEAAIKQVSNMLARTLGGPRSQKTTGWQLRLDTDKPSNPNADKDRKEYKLIGHYPVIENGNIEAHIPVEIQIMTQADYDENETGAKHHDVYVAIQDLVEDDRPTDPIPEGSMRHIINQLARHNEAVYSSYPNYEPTRAEEFKAKAEKDIWQRMKQYFFVHEGNYYAYQHLVRLRNAPDIIRNEDELFRAMAENLNRILELRMHIQDWKMLFDSPEKLRPEIIATRIGIRVFELLSAFDNFKFSIRYDQSLMIKGLIAWLNRNVATADTSLWEKILTNSQDLTVKQRKFRDDLRRNQKFQKINGWETLFDFK